MNQPSYDQVDFVLQIIDKKLEDIAKELNCKPSELYTLYYYPDQTMRIKIQGEERSFFYGAPIVTCGKAIESAVDSILETQTESLLKLKETYWGRGLIDRLHKYKKLSIYN